MLNRVIFSLVVLSFLFLMPSFSQTTDVNLRVDSAFTTINPDTASFGSTFFYAYAVKNMDTVVYASTIYIMAKANNKPAFILDSISPVQLMAGDTIMRYKDDSITPLKYDGGINILVIWPDVPANFHNTNVDSVRKQVDVSGSVSLKDFRNEQLIEIYPNPASSKLQFRFVNQSVKVREIKLVDLQGKVIFRNEDLPDFLELTSIANGAYFIHISFADGRRQSAKILIQ